MNSSAKGVLQEATVIAKTTETLVGEIDCLGYSFLTLFLEYTKGDETGLDVYPYLLFEADGTEFPLVEWETVGGVFSATEQKLEMLASSDLHFCLDVRGIDRVKVYQGGSNNDGTPTGTLAVSYALKG